MRVFPGADLDLRRRVRAAVLGATFVTLTLSACGGGGGGSASGDTVDDAHVTLGSSAISNSLDPAAALSSVGRTYTKQVFDQLVTFDAEGTLQPSLATEWKRVDDTAIDFTLREGVTFSSGAPLDAAAVAANVERVLSGDPAYATVAGRIATVKEAKAVSPDVVRVVTAAPDAILLNRMTLLDIVDPATFGDDRPAGTGPFEVSDYEAGTTIELTRNADSWRASEAVEKVTIKAIPNPTTLASALRTGDVDVAFGLPADVAKQLETNGFSNVNEPAGSSAITSLIADVEPALEDPRVREAINLAVNREEFVEAALGGFGTPNGSQLLQEGYLGYDPSLPSYDFDLDRVKSLLSEAGAEGLELPIATTAMFKAQAEAVAGYLNAAGFKSEVVIQDLSAFIPTLLQKSEYPLLYWQTDYYDLRDISSVSRFGPTAPGQQAHIPVNDYQKLFVQQAGQLDEKAREADIKEMAKILNEEAGVLFLAWTDNVYTTAPRISDLPLSGDSLIRAEAIVVTE
ncbi:MULTISPECIES: ABC transporter substrate-binding protein [Mumia]|uniref:ABC transporter substrate-binding protein n=1 Tax=Mumia TaxID=1546255 RepID=UPI001422F571|nr:MULTISPECIES: ABC transporter substrate-binding protein [unclassified Mumia]QMW67507.1 ABC transporter substrate-binding protein [Mumia sp. ZJ1417]